MSRDDANILDMLKSARLITQFVAGLSEDVFLAGVEKQSALLYQLTVLGEAARRVSSAYRQEHPEVEWQAIADFRNHIVHEYDDIDLDLLWKVIASNVPKLVAALKAIAPKKPE